MFSRAVIAATHNPIVRRTVTKTRPGRGLAHRFVAGDTLDQATRVAHTLSAAGMQVSFDLLGEEVRDRATAGAALDGYLRCIERIRSAGLDANISVKLTQLGLSLDRGMARESLDRLARAAAEAGTSVTIDMEDSRFTAATIDLYAESQAIHGNLGVCLQAYLHRTPDDLERIAPLGGMIRLCKGAYVEPPDLAYQGGREVDAAFGRLLEALMCREDTTPAIATHDERLIDVTRRLAAGRKGPFEFQMLYGVRGALQRRLVGAGHPLRIYLPYGSEWYPYLTRRLAERPANLLFFLRAIVGRDR